MCVSGAGGCFGELHLFSSCSQRSRLLAQSPASAGTRDEGVESVSERWRGALAVRYGGDALAPTDQLIF